MPCFLTMGRQSRTVERPQPTALFGRITDGRNDFVIVVTLLNQASSLNAAILEIRQLAGG